MITTVTLSPAVDVEYHVGKIDPDGLNRASSHKISAGGKGINVSRAIMSCENKAGHGGEGIVETLCALGGATGEMLKGILESEGMRVKKVKISSPTRVNSSVISENGGTMEINSPGTPIGEALDEIEKSVLEAAARGDVIAICGSCPSDVAKTYPAELCRKVKKLGAVCVIDCDGEALKNAVFTNDGLFPDIIKPNSDELAALTGRKIVTVDDAMAAAESLPDEITIITTLAGDGSILTTTENGKRVSTLHPTVKRPVVRLKGAGDTFLGAYLWGRYAASFDSRKAMEFATSVAGEYVCPTDGSFF